MSCKQECLKTLPQKYPKNIAPKMSQKSVNQLRKVNNYQRDVMDEFSICCKNSPQREDLCLFSDLWEPFWRKVNDPSIQDLFRSKLGNFMQNQENLDKIRKFQAKLGKFRQKQEISGKIPVLNIRKFPSPYWENYSLKNRKKKTLFFQRFQSYQIVNSSEK